MKRPVFCSVVLYLTAISFSVLHGQESNLLDSVDQLDLVNVTAEIVDYQGKSAIHLTGSIQAPAAGTRGNRQSGPAGEAPAARGARRGGAGGPPSGAGPGQRPESLAIIKGLEFKNGSIEVELAGLPSEAAGDNARGFIGLAFHVEKAEPIAYDCFYLRPTNGRAEDQLRRNHSCQYISHPDFTFSSLRSDSPGVYESYVDLAPGAWTNVRIEVDGSRARLFVNHAEQPCLIVNDLKRADQVGSVALWLEQSTNAYFRNLVVKPGN